MTHREKIEMLKDTIKVLYVEEGRNKSYIARLLKVDRMQLSKILNNEWKWKQGNKRYLTPSNQKFLNKHRLLIKSRLDNSVSLNEIAKELQVTRSYLGQTIIDSDKTLSLAREHYHLRKKAQAEKNLLDIKMESYHRYDFEELPNEIWKEILGYPTYYISNKGRVKRYVETYNDYVLINPHKNKNTKRLYVWVRKKAFLLHRLVGYSFVQGYSDVNNTINHKDGNIYNNDADNLEWVSQSENNKHSYRNLKRPTNRAYQSYGKFKKIILDDKYEFKTIVALARFLNVSETQVRRYIDGETELKHNIKLIY